MAYTPIALLKSYTDLHQEDESILAICIDAAESIVSQYLQYNPEYKQYTSILRGRGGYAISLEARPIHTIQEVIIDSIHVPPEHFHVSGQRIYSKEAIFSRGEVPNVIISYTAGYNTDSIPEIPIEDDDIIDGGDAFSNYESQAGDGGALIIPPMPKIITMTVLRIAAILVSESSNNIGVTSKFFGDSGTRTFINYTNFDKYLTPLSTYRIISI
jgi:hypothetical protein